MQNQTNKFPPLPRAGVRYTAFQRKHVLIKAGLDITHPSTQEFIHSENFNNKHTFISLCNSCGFEIKNISIEKIIRKMKASESSFANAWQNWEGYVCPNCAPRNVNQSVIEMMLATVLKTELVVNSRPIKVTRARFPNYFRKNRIKRNYTCFEIDLLENPDLVVGRKPIALEVDGDGHSREPNTSYEIFDVKRTIGADIIKDILIPKQLPQYLFIRVRIYGSNTIYENLKIVREQLADKGVSIDESLWLKTYANLPPIKSTFRDKIIRIVNESKAEWRDGKPPPRIESGTVLKLYCEGEQKHKWNPHATQLAKGDLGCGECSKRKPNTKADVELLAHKINMELVDEEGKTEYTAKDKVALRCTTCNTKRPMRIGVRSLRSGKIRECQYCRIAKELVYVRRFIRYRDEGEHQKLSKLEEECAFKPQERLSEWRKAKIANKLWPESLVLLEKYLGDNLNKRFKKGKLKDDEARLEYLKISPFQPGGYINTNHTDEEVRSIVRHFSKRERCGALDPILKTKLDELCVKLPRPQISKEEWFSFLEKFIGENNRLPKKTDDKRLYEWMAENRKKALKDQLSDKEFARKLLTLLPG